MTIVNNNNTINHMMTSQTDVFLDDNNDNHEDYTVIHFILSFPGSRWTHH